jgi:hypothetical protein
MVREDSVADLNREELQRLARLGAEARLKELLAEEAAIRRAFPHVFRGRRSPANVPEAAAPVRRRQKRRSRMSPAARKAVSERMKKYWAARRRGNA